MSVLHLVSREGDEPLPSSAQTIDRWNGVHWRDPVDWRADLEARYLDDHFSQVLEGRPQVRGISIDPHGAADLDDAFWLEKMPNGNWALEVMIPDVTGLLSPTSAVFQQVLARVFTVYGNDSISTHYMVPDQMAREHLSLKADRSVPTLSVCLTYDPEGCLLDINIHETHFRSAGQLSYEEAGRLMNDPGENEEVGRQLQMASDLSQRLKAQRLKAQPLARHEDAPSLVSPKQIIAEFMIAANQGMIQFVEDGVKAHDLLVPPVYRAFHNHAHPSIAYYSFDRKPHEALALDAYAHGTSPLRRAADWLLHYGVRAVLEARRGAQVEHIESLPWEHAVQHINVHRLRYKAHMEAYDRRVTRQSLQVLGNDEESLRSLSVDEFHKTLRQLVDIKLYSEGFHRELCRRIESNAALAGVFLKIVFDFLFDVSYNVDPKSTDRFVFVPFKLELIDLLSRKFPGGTTQLVRLAHEHSAGTGASILELVRPQGLCRIDRVDFDGRLSRRDLAVLAEKERRVLQNEVWTWRLLGSQPLASDQHPESVASHQRLIRWLAHHELTSLHGRLEHYDGLEEISSLDCVWAQAMLPVRVVDGGQNANDQVYEAYGLGLSAKLARREACTHLLRQYVQGHLRPLSAAPESS